MGVVRLREQDSGPRWQLHPGAARGRVGPRIRIRRSAPPRAGVDPGSSDAGHDSAEALSIRSPAACLERRLRLPPEALLRERGVNLVSKPSFRAAAREGVPAGTGRQRGLNPGLLRPRPPRRPPGGRPRAASPRRRAARRCPIRCRPPRRPPPRRPRPAFPRKTSPGPAASLSSDRVPAGTLRLQKRRRPASPRTRRTRRPTGRGPMAGKLLRARVSPSAARRRRELPPPPAWLPTLAPWGKRGFSIRLQHQDGTPARPLHPAAGPDCNTRTLRPVMWAGAGDRPQRHGSPRPGGPAVARRSRRDLVPRSSDTEEDARWALERP